MRIRGIGLSLVMAATAFGQWTHTIDTVAGGGFPPDGSTAISTGLGAVAGVAVDGGGRVFFSLSDFHVVLRLDPDGTITRVAGNGSYGYSGDDGPAASAQLAKPAGIALDRDGNLYIAEIQSRRVRKVSGGTITTVAGNGTAGFSGDNGPATAAQFFSPQAVAVDSAGNLYIADTGNRRIRKVSGGTITTFAGNGTGGSEGDNGPATGAQLVQPTGLAVDSSGTLYIADRGAHRVRKVVNGTITTFVAGSTAGDSEQPTPIASASISYPYGIAVDAAGDVFVANQGRVRKIAGGMVAVVAGSGAPGYGGDGGPARDAQLGFLQGVAVDSTGNIFIADTTNFRVRMATPSSAAPGLPSNSIITTLAGNGSGGFGGDDGPAMSAQMAYPDGIARAANGDLYIADSQGNRVRRVSGGVMTTVAGSGVRGYSGDGGPATSAQLAAPTGVAVDAEGNVYIADSGNHAIRKVSGGAITTIAGNGSSGFAGEGSPAIDAQFNSPLDVAVDSAGDLYISDEQNFRVRRISKGAITTFAGVGGQGYGGDGGPAANAMLNRPQGLAFDAAGNLYIADTYNHRIRKVSGGIITTVAGNGTQGTAGSGGPATAAQLNNPSSVAVDASGNLYTGSTWDWGVHMVSGGVIRRLLGTGGWGFSGDGGFSHQAKLSEVRGLAADPSGKVYFSDALNHRIRTLTPNLAAVSAASFTPNAPLAPGVIAAAFGTNLAASLAVAPATGSLPIALADRSVRVLDSAGVQRSALLWFVSPGQINFQIPEATAPGPAAISVSRETQIYARCYVEINAVAPALFTMNTDGRGVPAALAIFVKPDQSQTWQYVFNEGCLVGACRPVPLDLGADGVQVILQLYGTGFRGRSSLAAVRAAIGGVDAQVDYAGPVEGMVGLDQVNVRVPRSLTGRGEVTVALTVDGVAANPVAVNIK